MSRSHPATPARLSLVAALAVLVTVPVLVGVIGSRSTPSRPTQAPHLRGQASTSPPSLMAPIAQRRHRSLRGSVPGEPPEGLHGRGLGAADGEVAAGTTVFSDVPAVARLDPGLRAALRRAATDGARYGVELDVNSGWRSRRYQARLFRDAVERYGSETTAERWVARPDTSVHEAGDAVDLGPDSATTWLARHGAGFGLCRIYRNEPWHYELRPDAAVRGCPRPYDDPSQDPRMQP